MLGGGIVLQISLVLRQIKLSRNIGALRRARPRSTTRSNMDMAFCRTHVRGNLQYISCRCKLWSELDTPLLACCWDAMPARRAWQSWHQQQEGLKYASILQLSAPCLRQRGRKQNVIVKSKRRGWGARPAGAKLRLCWMSQKGTGALPISSCNTRA